MTQEETNRQNPECVKTTKQPGLWKSQCYKKEVEGVEAKENYYEIQLIDFIGSEERGLESAIKGILGKIWGDLNMGWY